MKQFPRLRMQVGVWLRNLFIPPYRTRVTEGNLPDQLKRKTLYIVQEDGFLEHVSMLCPCGCGRVLYMNLISDERPCWRITEHPDGTVSLHPSIWRKKNCQSHFWFRQGRIYWCESPPRSWWQKGRGYCLALGLRLFSRA